MVNLNLGNNTISGEGMQTLLSALKYNSTLQILDLSNYFVTDDNRGDTQALEDTRALAEFMKENRSLQIVKVGGYYDIMILSKVKGYVVNEDWMERVKEEEVSSNVSDGSFIEVKEN